MAEAVDPGALATLLDELAGTATAAVERAERVGGRVAELHESAVRQGEVTDEGVARARSLADDLDATRTRVEADLQSADEAVSTAAARARHAATQVRHADEVCSRLLRRWQGRHTRSVADVDAAEAHDREAQRAAASARSELNAAETDLQRARATPHGVRGAADVGRARTRVVRARESLARADGAQLEAARRLVQARSRSACADDAVRRCHEAAGELGAAGAAAGEADRAHDEAALILSEASAAVDAVSRLTSAVLADVRNAEALQVQLHDGLDRGRSSVSQVTDELESARSALAALARDCQTQADRLRTLDRGGSG